MLDGRHHFLLHACLRIWSSLLQLSEHACLRNGCLYSSSQKMPVSEIDVFPPSLRACLSQEWSSSLHFSEHACLRNGCLYLIPQSMPVSGMAVFFSISQSMAVSGMVIFTPARRAYLSQKLFFFLS